jgi:hypothetical protein
VKRHHILYRGDLSREKEFLISSIGLRRAVTS